MSLNLESTVKSKKDQTSNIAKYHHFITEILLHFFQFILYLAAITTVVWITPCYSTSICQYRSKCSLRRLNSRHIGQSILDVPAAASIPRIAPSPRITPSNNFPICQKGAESLSGRSNLLHRARFPKPFLKFSGQPWWSYHPSISQQGSSALLSGLKLLHMPQPLAELHDGLGHTPLCSEGCTASISSKAQKKPARRQNPRHIFCQNLFRTLSPPTHYGSIFQQGGKSSIHSLDLPDLGWSIHSSAKTKKPSAYGYLQMFIPKKYEQLMNMTGFEVSRPGGVLLWRSQSHDWVCPKWRSHLLHDTRVQRLYLQQQPGGQVRSSYVKPKKSKNGLLVQFYNNNRYSITHYNLRYTEIH